MEKLIYLLDRKAELSVADFGERLLDRVPQIKAHGGRDITINVADLNDEVDTPKTLTPRICGSWGRMSGAASFWLDCLDVRGGIEEVLAGLCKGVDGYLVTESLVQTCPRTWNGRERRPGVTQFALCQKPESISDELFFRRWQEEYGPFTFELHPWRRSYVRNTVARPLTPGAPKWRCVSLEHWERLEDFTDQDRYFGSPEAAAKNFADVPGFVDLTTITVGPMSEYHFD